MKNKIFKNSTKFNGNLMGTLWEPCGNLMGALSNANETHVKTKCRIAELQNCRTAHLHICKTEKTKFANFANFATSYFARVAAVVMMIVALGVGDAWANVRYNNGDVLYIDFTQLPGDFFIDASTAKANLNNLNGNYSITASSCNNGATKNGNDFWLNSSFSKNYLVVQITSNFNFGAGGGGVQFYEGVNANYKNKWANWTDNTSNHMILTWENSQLKMTWGSTIESDPCSGSCTAPTITGQPVASANYEQNASATSLNVTASGENLTYQWQVSDNGSSNWTNVASNGTSASYTPSTATIGDKYYRCIVSSSSCTTTSTSSHITVTAAVVKYTLNLETQPLNTGYFTVDGVTYNPSNRLYPAGQHTIKVYPNLGYTFSGWTGDASGSERQINLTTDQSYTANMGAAAQDTRLDGCSDCFSVEEQ